jgi:RNA polymerase sigma-70 factor (ECF subfamily)
MDTNDMLAQEFEEHRDHLRGVAHRMLGSLSEADDALQEAWLRVSRAGTVGVENLGGWLTTVVARVCLNMLRSRGTRREEPLSPHVPDPVVTAVAHDPEQEALLADSVGLALLVVLETLPPAERLAFVLHDMFAVPFEDIAEILERSPAAARQAASRGRRRVRSGAPTPDSDLKRQRAVVDAFFAAARKGDFVALIGVLDPEVILRSDRGVLPGTAVVRGPEEIAQRALMFADPERVVRPVLVNGMAGVVITMDGAPVSIMGFTVVGGKIVAIDSLGDPERLARIDLPSFDE